jgi:hypothetical protein
VLALRSHCADEVAWALNALAVLSAGKTPDGAIRLGRQDPSTPRHNLVDALVTLVLLGMLKVAPPEYDDDGERLSRCDVVNAVKIAQTCGVVAQYSCSRTSL